MKKMKYLLLGIVSTLLFLGAAQIRSSTWTIVEVPPHQRPLTIIVNFDTDLVCGADNIREYRYSSSRLVFGDCNIEYSKDQRVILYFIRTGTPELSYWGDPGSNWHILFGFE